MADSVIVGWFFDYLVDKMVCLIPCLQGWFFLRVGWIFLWLGWFFEWLVDCFVNDLLMDVLADDCLVK